MKNPTLYSTATIQDYMKIKVINKSRHQAHVLISSNGKDIFNAVLFVCPIKSSVGTYYLIVEGNNEYTRRFLPEYNNQNASFYMVGKTFIITTKDIFGNAISININ